MKVKTRNLDTIPDTAKAEALRKMIEGRDRKTEFRAEELPGWDAGVKESLERLLASRYALSIHEEEVDKEKKEIMKEIQSVMEDLGVESVIDEAFGSVSVSTTTKKTVDHGKLREELVRLGVPASTVGEAFNLASRETKATYATYRKPKER